MTDAAKRARESLMGQFRLECKIIENGIARDVAIDGEQVAGELIAALQVAAVIRDMPPAVWSAFVALDPAAIDRLIDQFIAAQTLFAMCTNTVNGARERLQGAAGAPREAIN